ERYLPGFELPSTVQVTADLAEATRGAELLLAATPVAGLRSLLDALATPAPLVWLCKGFEEGTGELPHQIARAALGSKARFGALSGPSFAEEVAGGQPETFMGLAGAGDLILTATGDLSRNRRVGLELARGRALGEIVATLGHVAEGVHSAREVAKLAARHRVEMPVSEAVCAVLDGRISAAAAVERLLARESKMER